MESSDSMCDNGCDDDTPLKQVVQLCSLLAGKGLQFDISVRIKNSFVFSLKSEKFGPSQGTRRSPSYARRQERRKLLRKKSDVFPEEPMESRETNNDCSLDLSPNPDSGLFGNREESEEESIAAESENDSEKEDGSDASSRDPVEPEEGDNWTPVTPRVRRQGGPRVSIVNSYNRHRIVEEKSTGGGPSGKDICRVTYCVYAPADAARADIERAMLNKDFTKIKLISGPTYNPKYEFSSDGRFHLSGNEIFPHKEIWS